MSNIPRRFRTDENLIGGTSYKTVLSFQYTFTQCGHYHQLYNAVVQIKETYVSFTKRLGFKKYSFSSNKQKKRKERMNVRERKIPSHFILLPLLPYCMTFFLNRIISSSFSNHQRQQRLNVKSELILSRHICCKEASIQSASHRVTVL